MSLVLSDKYFTNISEITNISEKVSEIAEGRNNDEILIKVSQSDFERLKKYITRDAKMKKSDNSKYIPQLAICGYLKALQDSNLVEPTPKKDGRKKKQT